VPPLRARALAPVVPAPEGGRGVSQSERRRKSLLAVWRDLVCESEQIGPTPKLVALVLSTFMNGRGYAYPSQEAIAAKASLSARTVRDATAPLEDDGLLDVDRSVGRSSHGYQATLPPTANALRRSEWAAALGTPEAPSGSAQPDHAANPEADDTNPETDAANPEAPSGESAESAESGALRAAAADDGGAASAQKFDPQAVEEAAARLA